MFGNLKNLSDLADNIPDSFQIGDVRSHLSQTREADGGTIRARAFAMLTPEAKRAKVRNDLPARPVFDKVAEAYVDEALPALAAPEKERRELLAKRNEAAKLAGVIGVGGLIIGQAMKMFLPAVNMPGLFILVCMGIALFIFIPPQIKLSKATRRNQETVINIVARALGLSYERSPQPPASYQNLCDWKLFASHNRQRFQDAFSGTWHGADFHFCELKLQREEGTGKNRRVVNVFSGCVLEIDFHQKLFGQTVLLPKSSRGIFSGLGNGFYERRGLKKVGVVAPAFEDQYTAFTNDQMEARTILDPKHLERLADFEREIGGSKLRAHYDADRILIAVEGDNMFEIGSGLTLTDPKIVTRLAHEVDSIFSLIDFCLKRERPAA